MATTNKDFVVNNGLRVATGVTFSNNTTQTTAYNPNSIILSSEISFPENPYTGQMFFNSADGKIYIYINSWLELEQV